MAPPSPPDNDVLVGAALRTIRVHLGAYPEQLGSLLDDGNANLVHTRESGDVPLTRDAMREHLAALVLLATRVR